MEVAISESSYYSMDDEIRKEGKIIKTRTLGGGAHGTETQASEEWVLLSRSLNHWGNQDGTGYINVGKAATAAVTGQNYHCWGEESLLREAYQNHRGQEALKKPIRKKGFLLSPPGLQPLSSSLYWQRLRQLSRQLWKVFRGVKVPVQKVGVETEKQ